VVGREWFQNLEQVAEVVVLPAHEHADLVRRLRYGGRVLVELTAERVKIAPLRLVDRVLLVRVISPDVGQLSGRSSHGFSGDEHVESPPHP
jgi:hypothetical protein